MPGCHGSGRWARAERWANHGKAWGRGVEDLSLPEGKPCAGWCGSHGNLSPRRLACRPRRCKKQILSRPWCRIAPRTVVAQALCVRTLSQLAAQESVESDCQFTLHGGVGKGMFTECACRAIAFGGRQCAFPPHNAKTRWWAIALVLHFPPWEIQRTRLRDPNNSKPPTWLSQPCAAGNRRQGRLQTHAGTHGAGLRLVRPSALLGLYCWWWALRFLFT